MTTINKTASPRVAGIANVSSEESNNILGNIEVCSVRQSTENPSTSIGKGSGLNQNREEGQDGSVVQF